MGLHHSRPGFSQLFSAAMAAILILSANSGAFAAEKAQKKPLPSLSLAPPILLKVNSRSSNLTVADFNSDGLPDLLTVANEKSILELFLQEGGKEPSFKSREVVLDQFVQGLAALDVDGDGRTDVITAGSPARLSWLRQTDAGVLSSPQKLDPEAEDLIAEDINGDKAPDLILKNGRRIEVVPSGKRGLDWEKSTKYWSAWNIQGAPWIVDLDSDGLMDMVFTEAQRNDRVIIRFQTPEGLFPDEMTVPTSAINDLAALTRTKHRQTLAALLGKTDSIEQLGWAAAGGADSAKDAKKDKDPGAAVAAALSSHDFGRIRTIAFDPETRSDRLVAALAPLADGGIPCILIAGPSFPSVRVIRTTRDGSLMQRSAPSLTGIAHILTAPPAKKGGEWHVGLVSSAENTLAFCRISGEGESLTFPRPVRLGGAPLTAALAPLGRGKGLDLAVCRADAKNDALVMEIHFDFNPATGTDEGVSTFTLAGKPGDRPSGLLAADINGDDRVDLIALSEYADPVILLQNAPGAAGGSEAAKETWEPLALKEGMLASLLTGVRAGHVHAAPLGPKGETSLLITKENYARAVRLGPDGQVVVDGQFNGKNQKTRLRAAIAARVEKGKPPQVILLDVGNQNLSLFRRAEKGEEFILNREVDIDDADYQTLLAADINEDGNEDILLLAPDRMTAVYSGMPAGRLETLAKAKTDIENGAYGRVATVALLNKDEQQIVAVENTENVLEMFTEDAVEGQLQRFFRFKVFNTDSVRGRRELKFGETEPREIIASDVNQDDKPDLLLLMNDVVGVYLQK